MQYLTRPHILSEYEDTLKKCEGKIHDMPPNDEKAKIIGTIADVRDTFAQIDAAIAKSAEIEATLNVLIDRVEEELDRVMRAIPKREVHDTISP